jgi:hypothetical protein
VLSSKYIVDLTREFEYSRPGSWIGSLFDFHAPRCAFSTGGRRLLLCAMANRFAANTALARELSTSLPTVKKTWLAIYNRVAKQVPELFVDNASDGTRRGTEKRRQLLAYLQEHSKELRPIARQRNEHRAR